ncbi:MAG: hypothetical protein DMD35_18940 [Gemmatimonadetes bacterium]|nr:MAG: hypothetical protein DMD35_18940 [Gemmatimonadota bacterium]
MTMHYTLMSHGTVLGHTGAMFPPHQLPANTSAWHLVPTAAFDLVEPIIAELTAPPALALVQEVIPTQDAYLHPLWGEHESQMERLTAEAARIHHFRLVLERYEALDLELRDATGIRVATTTLVVTKQLVPAEALRAYVEAMDPQEAHWVGAAEPCYLLMARLALVSAASAA